MGNALPYNSADALRERMREEFPTFAGLNYAPGNAGATALKEPFKGISGVLSDEPMFGRVSDFYLTNPIARASKTMAECSMQKQSVEMSEAAE